MTQLTLTAEQSALLLQAAGPVLLVDASGKSVGQVSPPSHFTPEELAEMEARIGHDGPYVTTAELLSQLQTLATP